MGDLTQAPNEAGSNPNQKLPLSNTPGANSDAKAVQGRKERSRFPWFSEEDGYKPDLYYLVTNVSDKKKVELKHAENTTLVGLTLEPQTAKIVVGKELKKLNQEALRNLQGVNELVIKPLDDYVDNRFYRIANMSKEKIQLKDVEKPEVVRYTIEAGKAQTIYGEILNTLNLDDLRGKQGVNDLVIRPLDLSDKENYTLYNLTAKRIHIRHNYYSAGLYLPAFGSRTVDGETLLNHSYSGWESQGLVQIEVDRSAANAERQKSDSIFTGVVTILLIIFVIAGVVAALFSRTSWSVVGIGAVVGVVLVFLSLMVPFHTIKNIWKDFLDDWLKLLPGISLVLFTGIGLPAAIIYFFGDGRYLLNPQKIELPLLGRLLQVGFISIAAMLPAFLFFLFGRQQVDKQRESFYREAMLLDPNVWSDSEAKNKYEPLLNSVFDTGRSPFSILLLVISTALLVMGWVLVLSPIDPVPSSVGGLIPFFTPVQTPLTFGFMGAYFFTINMIYRRYVRADLTPKSYAYVIMRLLVTLVLVWALGALPQFTSEAGTALNTGLYIVAFIVGIFPETGLTLIQEQFKTITRQNIESKGYELTRLEGMNLYDQARLLEEGIENIENLAHHNLMELMARTRIPTPRLVDMFDQAILYLHLGPENNSNSAASNAIVANGTEDDMRTLLKSLGIRTATDLIQCKDKLKAFEDDPKYRRVIKKLPVIINTFEDDEWLNCIQSWRKSGVAQEEPIENPYRFYFTATGDEKMLESSAQPSSGTATK